MAENSSNGHTNGHPPRDQQPQQPLSPRVAAPEGARVARAYDGSPIELAEPEIESAEIESAEIESAETTAFDAASSDAEPASSGADSAHSFAEFATHGELVPNVPDLSAIEVSPPLSIAIEEATDDEELPAYSSYPRAAPSEEEDYDYDSNATALAVDDIEGEQLFADSAETDPTNGGYGGGDEPPSNGLATSGGNDGRPDTLRDQELGLFEHLVELRSRLIYGILGVALMMCLTWHYSNELQGWFSAPILKVLNANGVYRGNLISTDPTAFFTLYFQFSLFSALILAMPWVLFQVWRFIEPAMTNSERRYTLVLVPFSSTLFFLGAALGYVVSPLFFQFFLQFQPPGVAAQWKYDDSLLLMVKMLLIFGLAFQVPIIIIFGHKVGLISRNLLIQYWRHAVVVIFVVVAILTPTWDPVTLTACAVPPCLLYLLSIWLVKWL